MTSRQCSPWRRHRGHRTLPVLVVLGLAAAAADAAVADAAAADAAAVPLSLGTFWSVAGWRYDIAVAADNRSRPRPRPGSEPDAIAAGWQIRVQPHAAGIEIEQSQLNGRGGAPSAAVGPKVIRSTVGRAPAGDRPRIPGWLGSDPADGGVRTVDGGRSVFVGWGWREAPPAGWGGRLLAAAGRHGVALQPLPLGDRDDGAWAAAGHDGVRQIVVTAHPERGGTGWVVYLVGEPGR